MSTAIDHGRLKDIIEKNLMGIPNETKKSFAPFLSKPDISWFTFSTDRYFMLTFIDTAGKQRIDELIQISVHPFPGLIAESDSMPAAFRFEKTLNAYVFGQVVPPNRFSLSLGEDSTVILCNHTQAVESSDLNQYQYVIDLAYIISFGKIINPENIYDFIEDAIKYSIKQWIPDDRERLVTD